MTRRTFQLILVGCALLIYMSVYARLVYVGANSAFREWGIFLLSLLCVCVIAAVFLVLLSFQRISFIGSLIICLYTPILIILGYFIYDRFSFRDYHSDQEIFYGDERKALAEKLQHYVVDNELVHPPYHFDFISVHRIYEDSLQYASFYFYTFPDSSDFEVLVMISDTSGEISRHVFMTPSNPIASRIYDYKRLQYRYSDSLTKTNRPAGTYHSLNDSLLGDAFDREAKDTIRISELFR